ncbi:hypothetical protein V6N12_066636 [Hibiscus sabdariffa]|uniref:Uncharacterized protein n=1 Tax=Hibiscus sabdariffa TaxID=183260 RepID=A0ABR2CSE5_9ROSI
MVLDWPSPLQFQRRQAIPTMARRPGVDSEPITANRKRAESVTYLVTSSPESRKNEGKQTTSCLKSDQMGGERNKKHRLDRLASPIF